MQERETLPSAGSSDTQPIGLSSLELTAALAFADTNDEDGAALAAHARAAAQALGAGPAQERDRARQRYVARAISVTGMQMRTLELGLANCIRARDDRQARTISKALDGMARRMAVWLAEHRLGCSSASRSVTVAVDSAGVTLAAKLETNG